MKKTANELLSLKLLLFIFGIFLIQTTTAQNLKTYSGVYKLTYPLFLNGTATYTYYENPDTYERVREGHFKFIYKIQKNKVGSGTITIEGNYKNNLKHGKWTYTEEEQDLKSGDYYMTGVTKLIANYNNGVPHGSWVSLLQGKSRQVFFNRNKLQYEFGEWRGENKAKLTANFTNGMLTGKVNYTKTDKQTNKNTTVDFELDKDGFFIGKFITDEGSGKYINEFENGFLFKTVSVNTQNGDVKVNDYTDDLRIAKEIQNIKETNPLELENLDFKLIQSTVSNRFLEVIISEHFFNNDLFRFNDIKGDVNFKEGKYHYDGFKTYVIERQVTPIVLEKFKTLIVLMNKMGKLKKFLPKELVKVIRESDMLISSLDKFYLGKYDSYVTGDNEEKMRGYQRVQYNNSFFKDIPENKALDMAMNKVTENYNLLKSLVKNDYDATMEKANLLFDGKNYTDATIYYEKAKNYGFDEELINEKLTQINDILEQQKKEAIDKKYKETIDEAKRLFDTGNYSDAIRYYNDALTFNRDEKFIKDRLIEIKRLKKERKNNTIEYNEIIRDIPTKQSTIERLYKTGEQYGGLSSGLRKKKLYNAYAILNDALIKQVNETSDINVRLEKSRVLLKLYALMETMSSTNTKQLEKQLKNQTDPKMIQKILGL